MRMKQKVSISSLPIHWGILILLIFIPQLLSAQENNDSYNVLHLKFFQKRALHILYIQPDSQNICPVFH